MIGPQYRVSLIGAKFLKGLQLLGLLNLPPSENMPTKTLRRLALRVRTLRREQVEGLVRRLGSGPSTLASGSHNNIACLVSLDRAFYLPITVRVSYQRVANIDVLCDTGTSSARNCSR